MKRETFNFPSTSMTLGPKNINFPIQQLKPLSPGGLDSFATQLEFPATQRPSARDTGDDDDGFFFDFLAVRRLPIQKVEADIITTRVLVITLSPIILDGKSPEEWKGKYPPWELTYPLPKRYFWVDDYVPFPKMGYVSSLEGRTWYHCVAMISKLFVPDPLWGRLIDILFRTMPLPNHVQPWQCIHKMVELQKPFVQTMDFMQMC